MLAKKEDRNLFVLIVAVIALAALVRNFTNPPGFYYMNEFTASQEWIELSNRALARLNIPLGVSINPSGPGEEIEIFVFDSAGATGIPSDVGPGNCSYVGDGRTILCDAALIRSWISYFDLDKRQQSTWDEDGYITNRWIEAETMDQVERARLDLLTWVLAHEIGHLLEGHKGRFYFADHGGGPNGDSASYCHRMEYEADTYAVSLLPDNAIEDFYLFNYDLLNRELVGLACPDNPKVAFCENVMAGTGLALTGETIEDLLSGSHPQMIVRILRIGETAQSRQELGILAYQLDDVIRYQLKSIGSPSWRCR